MRDIAETVSNRRKYLRITQSDLAEMSGVSLRTVKAIEKGSGNPTIETLRAVLDALGLDITMKNRVNNE
jgi:y4mF family transcriptional regulator